MVIALFLALELTIANFIEPRLYGQSMGVSEIALLVSAAFWAFLWGPIGLVLSSPLTVCLVVLGRYIPRLELLAILLGDEPALDLRTSFYQRLLARDLDEAEDLVVNWVKESEAPQAIYDAMLLPVLSGIKQTRLRGDITEEDERSALQAIHEIVEDLGHRQIAPPPDNQGEPGTPSPAVAEPAIPIFGCPAHDAEDRLALEMLQQVLDPARWSLELIAPETLTAELLDLVEQLRPALVCIAAIPPGGLAHTRYLCKRLRTRFPDLWILVGRWGLGDAAGKADPLQEAATDPAATTVGKAGAAWAAAAPQGAGADPLVATLQEAGADLVATALLETRQQIASLLPVLIQGRNDPERHGDRPGTHEDGSSRRAPRDRHPGALSVAAGATTA
jgi:hypothetical protein